MSETATDRIYERLHADLLRGRFAPGTPLRFSSMREIYGCGTSPVREALFRLVANRMVVGEGHRGFRVPPISRTEIEDITSLRQLLDIEALRRAMRQGDDEWEAAAIAALHRLNRATVDAEDENDADVWEARHRAFHRTLLQGCGSPWLLHLWDQLYDQTERYRRLRFTGTRRTQRDRDILQEHRDILDATLARHEDEAIRLLHAHLAQTARYVLGTLGEPDGGGS